MNFEQKITQKSKEYPFRSMERNLLKVVIGEIQRLPLKKQELNEDCYAVVKNMITSNEETMKYLDQEDSRRETLLQENDVLRDLLPPYWTYEQIEHQLVGDGIDVKVVKSDGQAMGMAMKHLKAVHAIVEGETVREVVKNLRKS